MKTLSHKFVELIPDQLDDGTIYISLTYCTAIHKCCCGCQEEVVTPLSPTDWQLTFDGKSISLYPSIGNWNFKCKSHYWIRNNKILWSIRLSEEEINNGRYQDYMNKRKYYDDNPSKEINVRDRESISDQFKNNNWWSRLTNWWSRQ